MYNNPSLKQPCIVQQNVCPYIRSYDDKKGVRRQVTEIYVDNLEWLSASRKMENASEEKNKDADNSISDNNKLPF